MRRLPALLFVIFLLVIAYWADTATMPSFLKAVYLFPNGDRLGHLLLYGVLTFVLNLALPARRVRFWRVSLPLGTVLAAGFALIEELSQFFFPTRTPDLVDLSCGWLGVFIADWLFRRWHRRKKSPASRIKA